MILNRYCVNCGGRFSDIETDRCCPDPKPFWMEKDAAEALRASWIQHLRAMRELALQVNAQQDAATAERERVLQALIPALRVEGGQSDGELLEGLRALVTP